MPNNRSAFPYGLRESRTTIRRLKEAFGRKLVILLGEKDVDENDENLRKTPEAMAQGKNRLERGRNFYEAAKVEARRLRTALNWQLNTVEGVAHSNSGMAPMALRLLVEQHLKKPPQKAKLAGEVQQPKAKER